MKNFRAKGCTMTLLAIAGALVSGQTVIVGDVVGISQGNYAIGEDAVLSLDGVFVLPKATSGAIAQGAKLYIAAANGNVTTTVSTNKFIGYAYEAAADGDATVSVLLAR
jgi:predicted RecA/RadA family phage recombinase